MIQKLDRVVLFDLDELLGQNIPEKLKNISAFPDQLNYPKKFLTDKRVFYPNKIGIDNAIRALIEHIVKIGVKIFTNSKIKKIEFNKNRIENICLQRNYDEYNKIKTDNIIWTVPPFSLYKLLFPKIEFPIFDPPKKTIIINILTLKHQIHRVCIGCFHMVMNLYIGFHFQIITQMRLNNPHLKFVLNVS